MKYNRVWWVEQQVDEDWRKRYGENWRVVKKWKDPVRVVDNSPHSFQHLLNVRHEVPVYKLRKFEEVVQRSYGITSEALAARKIAVLLKNASKLETSLD